MRKFSRCSTNKKISLNADLESFSENEFQTNTQKISENVVSIPEIKNERKIVYKKKKSVNPNLNRNLPRNQLVMSELNIGMPEDFKNDTGMI